MKVKTVFLFFNRDVPTARATVDVPGLGEVQIDSALSVETHDRVIAALRAYTSIDACRIYPVSKVPTE